MKTQTASCARVAAACILCGLFKVARGTRLDVETDGLDPLKRLLLCVGNDHEHTTTLHAARLDRKHGLLLLAGRALVADERGRLQLNKPLRDRVGLGLEVPQLVPLQNKPAPLPCLDGTTLFCQVAILVVWLQARDRHLQLCQFCSLLLLVVFKKTYPAKKKGERKKASTHINVSMSKMACRALCAAVAFCTKEKETTQSRRR